jgi:5-hydroxyisourate hydrolase
MSQITTHVLDTTRGKPAAGVPISLFSQSEGRWTLLAQGVTNQDGRIAGLLDDSVKLSEGVYRMHFETNAYFDAMEEKGFYPFVDVVFELDAGGTHYHIPLLLSAYGYSTYRGS